MGNWVEEYCLLRADEQPGTFVLRNRLFYHPTSSDGTRHPYLLTRGRGIQDRSAQARSWRKLKTTLCEGEGCRLDATFLHLDLFWLGLGEHDVSYDNFTIHRCTQPEAHQVHSTISSIPQTWLTTYLYRDEVLNWPWEDMR